MSEPLANQGAPLPAEGTSGKAIASLVLGLMSFVCMALTGLPAIIFGVLGIVDANRSQGRVRGQALAIIGIVLGGIGTLSTCILPALLLPAIQAARVAAQRTVSMNNLRIIGMALHGYEAREGHFPMAAGGEEGQPKHSWRVAILPYLEQAALHGRYQLNEEWDSPTNSQLINLMPEVFKSPGEKNDKPGMTNVVAIVGDETMWPSDKPATMASVSDGLSQTIMLIEVANTNGIPWTKPQDMSFDDFVKGINQPGGPESIYPGGILMLYADGSSRFLDATTAQDTLRALATRDGREPVVLP